MAGGEKRVLERVSCRAPVLSGGKRRREKKDLWRGRRRTRVVGITVPKQNCKKDREISNVKECRENQEALSHVEMRSLCTSEFAFIPDKVCIKCKGFRNKCLVKKKR